MTPAVKQSRQGLLVQWGNGSTAEFSYLWLRDNCRCEQCMLVQTREKVFHITSVPVDIQPTNVEIIKDRLTILWPDQHLSTFSADEIRALKPRLEKLWRPWKSGFQPQKIGFHEFLQDDDLAIEMIESFLVTGVCVLVDAPVKPGTLELLTPRLGPIRELLFDRIHDVEVDPHGYNVAHTALKLPPHNDFASYDWPPSLQALHMLVNETAGGESTLVDAWSVLAELREVHPEFFDVLSRFPVPFRQFDDNNETYTVAPLVQLDASSEVTSFRFSNQLMQVVDPDHPEVQIFYKAYHELFRRLKAKQATVSFRLSGGEILLVAAHRVLHGREAIELDGKRHLQDAYYEYDHLKNHLSFLRRKLG